MPNPLSVIQKSMNRSQIEESPEIGNVTGFNGNLALVSINGASVKTCVPPRDSRIEVGDVVAIFKPKASENWYITNVYSKHRSGKPDAVNSAPSLGTMPNYSIISTASSYAFLPAIVGTDVNCSPILRVQSTGRPVMVLFSLSSFFSTAAAVGNTAVLNFFIESDVDDSPMVLARLRASETSVARRNQTTIAHLFNGSKGTRDFRLKANFSSMTAACEVTITLNSAFAMEL